MTGLVADLIASCDDIFAIRNDIGAQKKCCSLVVRTWSGERIGEGVATEVISEIYPAPWVVEYKADSKIYQGGVIQQGDIVLKTISKNKYPDRALLINESKVKNVEKLYDVGGILYQAVSLTEDYVHWAVQLRRVSDQRRY